MIPETNVYRKYYSNHDSPNTLFRQYSAIPRHSAPNTSSPFAFPVVSFFFFPPFLLSLSLSPLESDSIQAEERRRNGRRKEQRKITRVNGAATRNARAKYNDICSPRCCRYPANIYSYDNRYTARGFTVNSGNKIFVPKMQTGADRSLRVHLCQTKSLLNVSACSSVIRTL